MKGTTMNTFRERVKALATQKSTKPVSIYCGQDRKKEPIYATQRFACTVESIGKAIQHANQRDVQGESLIIKEFDADGKTELLNDNAWQLLHTLLAAGVLGNPTFRGKESIYTYQILSYDEAHYASVTA